MSEPDRIAIHAKSVSFWANKYLLEQADHAVTRAALLTLQRQEMCICEHPRTRHPLVNHSDSCLVPTCRCASFRAALLPSLAEKP